MMIKKEKEEKRIVKKVKREERIMKVISRWMMAFLMVIDIKQAKKKLSFKIKLS